MADAESRIKDVADFLTKVESQLVHVAHLDDIFWQVQAIIRDNPVLASGGPFQEWIGQCYVDSVTAGLRRLADRRPDVISLWRVLQRMVTIAPLLTRERYLTLHEARLQAAARQSWADLVSQSKTHVPKALISTKQTKLEAALKKVSAFAHENVAHTSANPTHGETTFADVRKSIAAAFGVYGWCSRILTAKAFFSPVPTILEPWLKVFRVPWLPPGHSVPKYRPLQEILSDQKPSDRGAR